MVLVRDVEQHFEVFVCIFENLHRKNCYSGLGGRGVEKALAMQA